MNKLLATALLVCFGLCISVVPLKSYAEAIDAVVATVDEQPILLSELNKSLPKPLTMSEAASDSNARTALDRLIFESLLTSEAQDRRVSVSDADIERYVDEVANRNGLSREGFVDALKAQGKDWITYRAQVKADILQTRLASVMLQGMSSVKDEELDRYFEAHPELLQQGASITLRRFIALSRDAAQEYAEREISSDDFVAAVKSHSIGSDASEGGLLGNLAESDLAPEIFSALMHTKPGFTSSVVADPSSNFYTVYYVVDRSSGSDDEKKALRDRVKRELSQSKLAQQMEGMFQTELFKNHTIDKKI